MRHVFGLLLWVSMGCTEDALTFSEWDMPWEMEWTEYTRVRQVDAAQIRFDGPPLSSVPSIYAPSDPVPVVDVGPPMRVLLESEGLIFLAYLDEMHVEEVISDRTHGAVAPNGSEEAGVWFAPGTAITWLSETQTRDHIAYTSDGVDLESWIPRGHIQPYYRPDTETLPQPQGRSVILLDEALLLDAPHGDVFGHLDNERMAWIDVVALDAETEGRLAVAVGATQDAHQLVAFDTRDGVHIRAFVATSDIRFIPNHHGVGMRLHGTSLRCGCAMSPRPNVFAGTPVYDSADGEVIGWVTNDRRFDLDVVDSDWARAPISWYWKHSEVWIKRSDVVDTPPPEHHGLLSTLLSLQDAPNVSGLQPFDDVSEPFALDRE